MPNKIKLLPLPEGYDKYSPPRLYDGQVFLEEQMRDYARENVAHATAAQQSAEQHPDDAAVDRFAAAMKAKLKKKRQEGRAGWQFMASEQLSALLHEHVRKGDPVDVANLAMMLHQNGQVIEPPAAVVTDEMVEILRAEVERLRDELRDRMGSAMRVHDLAAQLVDELDGLVVESDGVSGLHLNGDVATWDELLPGGRFERLSSLDELRAALNPTAAQENDDA